MLHAEGAGTVDAMTAGFATGADRSKAEGYDLRVQQSQNPADGTGIGQCMRAPAHALGKRQGRNHSRADLSQQIPGRRAAGALAHGHICALLGLQPENIRHAQAVGTGKTFQSLGGRSVRPIGHTRRRAGNRFFFFALHGVEIFHQQHGPTRRAHDAHGTVLQAHFTQSGHKAGPQLLLFRRQKTGSQLFALCSVQAGHARGQSPHPTDEAGALGNGNSPARIQKIEGMRAFQAVIIGGPGQAQIQHVFALPLEIAELAQQHFRVADFKIMSGLLHLVLVINVAVGHVLVPAQVID